MRTKTGQGKERGLDYISTRSRGQENRFSRTLLCHTINPAPGNIVLTMELGSINKEEILRKNGENSGKILPIESEKAGGV